MAQNEKLVYPPGVRDLTEDISTDDLVRRLKECAQAFQNMSQEDDNSAYIPLALHLASETFLEHPSQDVRLLVASCIADVFRVFAPEAPYKDMDQLKVIFEFFVDQLRGLEDPTSPSFKRYFYLLENFTCVKTFNICVELEDNQKILCRLYKLMFKIINESHSTKVKRFICDLLSPLISEADVVSQELLDIILTKIIEPAKSRNSNACELAKEILRKNMVTFEPYIQAFFNNALILGKTLESDVAPHLYELIYELNGICPGMLVVFLPQLEFKLKSSEENERLSVTQVLARMFSDEESTMIKEHKNLWTSYLNRFNDISPKVRICCVQFCKNFLLNHPESIDDITEQLRQRLHDQDKNVRCEVVGAIINTAKEDFSAVNEELLSFVKERTLDSEFKVRKEALLGLAYIYRKFNSVSELTSKEMRSLSWIKNKVLHAYYQTSLEDRLLVERILQSCLVPYRTPMKDRMKLLYHLFCSVDDYAVKAFKEIMKCHSMLRTQVRSVLEVIQSEKNETREKTIASKVLLLSKNLEDPAKSYEHILKFCNDLESSSRLRNMLSVILNGNVSCPVAERNVKDILKPINPVVPPKNTPSPYYGTIKQLLERIAPVMIDKEGILHLLDCVKNSLLGDCSIEAELGLQNSCHRGLELLWVLTFVYPAAFHDEQIYSNLLLFLQVEDEVSADLTLQILSNISNEMEINFPEVSSKLLPVLENFVETGTSKQAKHAVYCINSIVCDKEKVFGNIIENLKRHFTLESQYFRTALVSVGHIAFLCHDMFAADLKHTVAQVVVKDLLMLDQDLPRGGSEPWAPLDSLPDETKVKIEGMKLMVRWLTGLKDMVQPAISTLRLLTTVILHDGDLMERQHTSPSENSWMRLSAASCVLKLCHEPNYANVITLDQFQTVAYTMNDKCPEVRDRFAQKVHKGLFTMKLPLEFLAVFCLAALDERKEFKHQVKNHLMANINKRKEFIKHRNLTQEKLRQILPDYALPFAIHLLAHFPTFKTYNDVPALLKIKECLWFLMEPLMTKNENYSFSFVKRLLENIKQTKDKQSPEDNESNMKMYAVCDLALNIILSKSTTIVLKDFPVEPALPGKLFTDPDLSYSNFKTYLPPELIEDKSSKFGIGIEIYKDPKAAAKSSAVAEESMDVSPSVIEESTDSTLNENSEHRTTRTRSKAKKKTDKTPVCDIVSDSDKTDSHEQEDLDCRTKHTKSESSHHEVVSNSCAKDKIKSSVKNSERRLRPSRSSRTQSTSSVKSSQSSECAPSDKRNGVLTSDMDLSTLCSSDIPLKECNVSLRKDEVEQYIALNNSTSDSLDEQNSSDDDAFEQKPSHNKSKKVASKPVNVKKRKREDSPISRSVRSKSSSSTRLSSKQLSNTSQNNKSKAVKANSTSSFPKSNSSIKKGNKLPLVNGSRGSKSPQKGSTPDTSDKSGSRVHTRRANGVKANLRKR